MLDSQVSVLVLADVGALDPATQERVSNFVETGGLLLRFAGPRLAAGSDDLVPVRLRRGGRNLGGTLSWDSPRTAGAVRAREPLRGSDAAGRYRRQAPDPGRAGRRSRPAYLGRPAGRHPIVTAAKRGEGMVVLVHVTADTTWSNLPLSGLFVTMLRRVVALAGTARAADCRGRPGQPAAGARPAPHPRRLRRPEGAAGHRPGGAGDLDGAGDPRAPAGLLRPGRRRPRGQRAHARGPAEALDLTALAGARFGGLEEARTRDLRGPFFLAALLLLGLDTLASLWLGGFLGRMATRLRRRPAAAALVLGVLVLGAAPESARAVEPAANRPNGIESALVTRIAYVVTGDPTVDETSRAGSPA